MDKVNMEGMKQVRHHYRQERAILSPKQMMVLGLITKGKMNKEIAAILGNCESTIKQHVKEIFYRLQVRNRVEAILKGYELGLVYWEELNEEQEIGGE
jgi:DNA-binding NarL/FixJ family response regulator